MMKNKYLKWFITRIAIPVGWFASSVYITRLAVNNVHIEFALGALVLILYAVWIDWPKNHMFMAKENFHKKKNTSCSASSGI